MKVESNDDGLKTKMKSDETGQKIDVSNQQASNHAIARMIFFRDVKQVCRRPSFVYAEGLQVYRSASHRKQTFVSFPPA